MFSVLTLGAEPEPIPAVDAIQSAIGGFGKYQIWLFIIISIKETPAAFHQMAILFLAPKVTYKCNGVKEGCPCDNPEFDKSIFSNTIETEWNLICKKKWLISLTQTVFQLGILVGSILFGIASDRFGRRKPLLVAIVLQLVTGVLAAYAPDFWSFTFIRFLVGGSVGGTMVVGFVLLMEFVGTEYRALIAALYHIPFNLGHIMLPLFGYFFRDYSTFQLAVSIPPIVLLLYFCVLPETARWLIAVKRTREAIHILERVAKINKRPTANIKDDIEEYQEALEKHHLRKGNILDLFRTPNLRKNILAMAFNWLTCSYCFFGVSQYVGQLGGDVFSHVAASASVALVGTLLAYPLLKYIGRKTIVIVFQFVNAFCLFVLIIVPQGTTGRVLCACIGVLASYVIFVVVYLYCSEMFPTVVRTAALGFSSMSARIGSMIAPFIIATQDTAPWLPPALFAVFPMLAGLTTFLLPETRGCELMTTIEEGEAFGKKTILLQK